MTLLAALLAVPAAAHADTVRPAVGKPLQQAELLIQARNYQAALLQLKRAAAVPHLSPYETVVIAEVHGAAASGAGEYRAAAQDYQQVLASGSEAPGQQTVLIQAIAGLYYQAGDDQSTITWVNRYIAAQGQDPRTRILLAQAYYRSGDYLHAEEAAQRDARAAQITGQAVPESELLLLANAARKSGDVTGYQAAQVELLSAYPSPAYWASAIDALVAAPEFPDRLALDVYRLRRATGTLTAPGQYEDFAERAISAGRPDEARAVLAEGFSAHILSPAADSGHAARLRSLLAADPPAPAAPQSALDLAIAAFEAGGTSAAVAAFNRIAAAAPAASPDAALARLWAIRAQRPVSG
jgi:hypothetical protein